MQNIQQMLQNIEKLSREEKGLLLRALLRQENAANAQVRTSRQPYIDLLRREVPSLDGAAYQQYLQRRDGTATA